jgi:hypothetical protein
MLQEQRYELIANLANPNLDYTSVIVPKDSKAHSSKDVNNALI